MLCNSAAVSLALFAGMSLNLWAADETIPADKPPIIVLDPPEQGFFSKMLDFHGILIQSHLCVSNEALYAAYDRIARETARLPMVVSNLAAAGAELHIIGRSQFNTRTRLI